VNSAAISDDETSGPEKGSTSSADGHDERATTPGREGPRTSACATMGRDFEMGKGGRWNIGYREHQGGTSEDGRGRSRARGRA
jgi:hypothetical protein